MSILEKVQNKWNDIDISNCDSLFKEALEKAVTKTEANIERFNDQFPYTGEGDKYILTNNNTWVCGYWTAWLWLVYYHTQDRKFKDAAERHFDCYNKRFNTRDIHCHDVGVIYDMAAVRGFAVTGESHWKNIAIRAAAVLATRFDTSAKFLQAWALPYDKTPLANRTIIDSLCCIPLWFWADKIMGDPYYKELACAQADTVLEKLVRPDYSSGHTFCYDSETRTPIGIQTHQGAADDSTWSRGQGWGIQGFAICYANTGDKKYLDTALKMLEWYIDALEEDIIPPWDFSTPNEERDTSSLTLTINGLIRLSRLPDISDADRQACVLMTKKAMTKLIENYAAIDNENAWGLVREGIYSKPGNMGIRQFMIWGDYYFIENLIALTGKSIGFNQDLSKI